MFKALLDFFKTKPAEEIKPEAPFKVETPTIIVPPPSVIKQTQNAAPAKRTTKAPAKSRTKKK